MERRVLLAISLSFLVLFLYQTFFAPARPPELPGNVSGNAAPGSPVAGVTTPGNLTAATTIAPAPPVATRVGDTQYDSPLATAADNKQVP